MVNCDQRENWFSADASSVQLAEDSDVIIMRFMFGLAKASVIMLVLVMLFDGEAWSQTARKFGKEPVTVRLCPVKCVAVNGHAFTPGGAATVFETRSGWARVSGYLDRAALVKSFGNSIIKKPALWVPVSQLAVKPASTRNSTKAENNKADKNSAPRNRNRRISQRKVTLPTFRPNTSITAPIQTNEPEISQPVQSTGPVVDPTVAAVETPEVVTNPKPELVIIDSEPTTSTPTASTTTGEGSRRALTWEELQAKLVHDAVKAAKSRESRDAAAKVDEARRAAEAERAAVAKKETDRKATVQAEAARRARLEADKQADVKAAADIVKTTEDAAKAAKTATAVESTKPANQKLEVVPEATEVREEAAVVLPPKQSAKPEPVFESAIADPIAFGSRPKTFTKALRDKRLKKLPGEKSKIRKEIVIALRHYALGLLNSNECTGIAGGGPSTTPDMLFVACTDDPGYRRQFPLEEQSW